MLVSGAPEGHAQAERGSERLPPTPFPSLLLEVTAWPGAKKTAGSRRPQGQGQGWHGWSLFTSRARVKFCQLIHMKGKRKAGTSDLSSNPSFSSPETLGEAWPCRGHARSPEATRAKVSLSVLRPHSARAGPHSPELCGPSQRGLGCLRQEEGHGLAQFAHATESLHCSISGSGASNVSPEVIIFFPHLILR